MNRLQQVSLELIEHERQRTVRQPATERWTLWQPFIRLYKARKKLAQRPQS